MFDVQSKPCSTCIYGKNSASRCSIAQLESEIADNFQKGFFNNFRRCHNSDSACCRGFWDRHKNHFQLGQLAQRLGLVVFVIHKRHKEE